MRAIALVLALIAAPALADVAGVASVIDGDTIEVHGLANPPSRDRRPGKPSALSPGRQAMAVRMVTGSSFSSPNQPDQERTTAYRDSSGPDSQLDAHCATVVGDWEEPSGESRFN